MGVCARVCVVCTSVRERPMRARLLIFAEHEMFLVLFFFTLDIVELVSQTSRLGFDVGWCVCSWKGEEGVAVDAWSVENRPARPVKPALQKVNRAGRNATSLRHHHLHFESIGALGMVLIMLGVRFFYAAIVK